MGDVWLFFGVVATGRIIRQIEIFNKVLDIK